MRYLLSILLVVLLCSAESYAFKTKKRGKRGLPRTEAGLVNNLLGCLQNKDTVGFYNLFLPFDTLWQLAINNPDRSPEAIQELNILKAHPQTLIEFDPHFNPEIMSRFFNVLQKGEDSGIHWKSIVMQRYELHKQGPTRKLIGYDRIAPERFNGYLFVRDMGSRLTFCIGVTEIQKVKNYFFGGRVMNILEASTMEEYYRKEELETKYYEWLAAHPPVDSTQLDAVDADSTGIDSNTSLAKTVVKKDSVVKKAVKKDSVPGNSGKDFLKVAFEEDEATSGKKDVVDRKYYEGKFDNEIPVKLYVRYRKAPGANQAVSYDGLYKFGDQVKYVRLEITVQPDGKWLMEDDIPLGILELELKNREFTGVWTNNDENGYDVVLKETPLSQKRMETYEAIMDKKISGRVDEKIIEKEEGKAEEKKAPAEKDKATTDKETGAQKDAAQNAEEKKAGDKPGKSEKETKKEKKHKRKARKGKDE
jgi:hypothetical protein